jgi:hypothetical protein
MTAIERVIYTWLTRRCIDCGEWKPLFTEYCDSCAEWHGL